jgi:hypothetical protein
MEISPAGKGGDCVVISIVSLITGIITNGPSPRQSVVDILDIAQPPCDRYTLPPPINDRRVDEQGAKPYPKPGLRQRHADPARLDVVGEIESRSMAS